MEKMNLVKCSVYISELLFNVCVSCVYECLSTSVDVRILESILCKYFHF